MIMMMIEARTSSIAFTSRPKAASPAATIPLLENAKPQHKEPLHTIIKLATTVACHQTSCKHQHSKLHTCHYMYEYQRIEFEKKRTPQNRKYIHAIILPHAKGNKTRFAQNTARYSIQP
jgi:hypothetical protein